MIKLEELNIWEKLSSPYGNSSEIPSLLIELSKTHDKTIADEVIWEYIYHQGSIYENTLATVPYLLNIIEKSDDLEFNLDLISSLGVVLIDLDGPKDLEGIFKNTTLEEKHKNKIQTTFMSSILQFKKLVNKFIPNTEILDEESKRFYLISSLVSEKKHKEAAVFKNFSGNDEYVFVCPGCEEEIFLWNEQNVLNAYKKDPVTNKTQTKLVIELNQHNKTLDWLLELVDKLNIVSLESMVQYFKGNINCHNCCKKFNVFEGVMNNA